MQLPHVRILEKVFPHLHEMLDVISVLYQNGLNAYFMYGASEHRSLSVL